jgi:arylsulfatase
VASDFGGTRNGMVISWPDRIREPGGLRTQFSHVIDIAPTVLEAAGLPEPTSVNGVVQIPIEGTSLLYAFNDAKAEERHTTQYFEMFGNRAIYHEGWFARTIHRAPWQTKDLPPLRSDVWELFDAKNDFSLTKNLAAEHPERLKELEALFMKEAQRCNVLPIDDRVIVRMNPAVAGRPDVMGSRTSLTLYEGMQGMLENSFMNVKNRSKKITAELDIPDGGANGVILTQGGRFGGWSLYVKDGKPAYTYNFLGLSRYTVSAPEALATGRRRSCSTSPTMAVVPARAARRRSWTTASRSPKSASTRPSPTSTRRTRLRTSASTTRPRSPKASASARRPASPARSTRSSSRWAR